MAEENSSELSLREAFRPERDRLSRDLTIATPPAQIVMEGRKALDRIAGEISNRPATAPELRKTALWLIEIVKSNTGLFDQGRETKINWREVASAKSHRGVITHFLFFAGAGAMMLAAFIFKNGGALYGLGALVGLRLLDPALLRAVGHKIPFVKPKPLALEDLRGRYEIDAEIQADPKAFLSHIDDSLAAADHILTRLSLPDVETEWHDNARLMGVVQNLLEAKESGDRDYALKLIDQELGALLGADGIEIITYSPKTSELFDMLPSLGETETRMAAPALVKEGRVIRRGTVWAVDNG